MADLTLAQMLALLADNTTGDISANDIQQVVQAQFERSDGTNPVNGLFFDTTPVVPAHTPGHFHWNATEGTIELDQSVAGVTLQVGQENYVRARNTTGSTILNGTPVRIIGAQGNRPLVSADNGQGGIFGVLTHNLANNTDGLVTTFGLVRELNTSAFAEGDLLYSTAAGDLSTAVSSSFVGTVTTAHASQGVILVRTRSFDNADGTTAQRPPAVSIGFMYFDTTLGKPIWWKGAVWVDATGATV